MEQEKITTLRRVVIEKEKLLKVLEENRAKHNAVYDIAVSGYWKQCQETLNQKKTKFSEIVLDTEKKLKTSITDTARDFNDLVNVTQSKIDEQNKDISFYFNQERRIFSDFSEVNGWNLTFPVNHLEDYNRTIRLIEMSFYDKIELDQNEFDCYVMNNWAWKNEFVSTNGYYLNSMTGCFDISALSGCYNYTEQLLCSGISAY